MERRRSATCATGFIGDAERATMGGLPVVARLLDAATAARHPDIRARRRAGSATRG
jgi:hypothetical protein